MFTIPNILQYYSEIINRFVVNIVLVASKHKIYINKILS